MPDPLTRVSLQNLSRIRLREARVLLGQGHYDGAYYLLGYVVECALKACIARRTRRGQFPSLRVARQAWRHDFAELISAAGLSMELDRSKVPIKSAFWYQEEETGQWRLFFASPVVDRQGSTEFHRHVVEALYRLPKTYQQTLSPDLVGALSPSSLLAAEIRNEVGVTAAKSSDAIEIPGAVVYRVAA